MDESNTQSAWAQTDASTDVAVQSRLVRALSRKLGDGDHVWCSGAAERHGLPRFMELQGRYDEVDRICARAIAALASCRKWLVLPPPHPPRARAH